MMRTRTLGKKGPVVSAIGLGCMGMSEFYGPAEEKESMTVILKALDLGINMLDTADMYGFGHNEELIGKTLKNHAADVFIATKCGIVRKPGEYARTIDNSPEYIRSSVEQSLRRLKRDTIDLFYLHRLNRSIPLEESIGTLSQLIHEGKIRHYGLSEVSPATVIEANAIHPITAVQSEFSLSTRDMEKELFPVLKNIGAGFVAYSPLGRGLLSASLNSESIAKEGDLRAYLPRTGKEFLKENLQLVDRLKVHADCIGCKTAQLALAWVLAKGDFIVPIPGTRHLEYLIENCEATTIELSQNTINALDELFYPGAVKGERYTKEGMVGLDA